MKIYTKTGDNQMTSIISKRVPKDDIILEVLGTIDELQASLMTAASIIEKSDIKEEIIKIAKTLFDLSKTILNYQEEITFEKVKEIEDSIDYYEEKLPPLHEFILPGMTAASSHIHLSRTIARRLERRLVTMGKQEKITDEVYQFVNRISDFLFVLARAAEKND